ncbi:hypothetical protein PIB30_054390 [Stylosanthes scabra]|uniref:DUF223 domain-containing protein n=1 Tax=Stylosanthes scabra TaxID=79078 RepID=A0ABU6UHH9_9FABA|nr:hypothetical protein [Stylosanthes scabra]
MVDISMEVNGGKLLINKSRSDMWQRSLKSEDTKTMCWGYDLIKRVNIGPEHKVWKLKVRIIRLWSVAHFATSGMKAPIEMVVLDEKGILIESNVYVITDFAVALNTIKFKTTKHEFRVHFKRNTIVRPMQDCSIPLNGFDFVPFTKIQRESKEDGHLVDVIGRLASKGDLVEFARDGKPSNYINIELDDLE